MTSCLWNFIRVFTYFHLLKVGTKGITGFFLAFLPSSQHPGNYKLIFCVPFMQSQLLVNDAWWGKLLQRLLHEFSSFWISTTMTQNLSFFQQTHFRLMQTLSQLGKSIYFFKQALFAKILWILSVNICIDRYIDFLCIESFWDTALSVHDTEDY